MKQARLLKQYMTQLQKLEQDRSVLVFQQHSIESDLRSKNKQIREIKDKIANINKSPELIVSEHAILRYFERVEGIDLNHIIESRILTESCRKLISELGGNGEYPTGTGFSIVLKDYTVVTIK